VALALHSTLNLLGPRNKAQAGQLSLARLLLLLLLSTLNYPLSTSAQGTAFTYQGRLNDGANPANGNYDLQFTIYDALSAGNSVAGPITNAPTGATNGLFTVTLDFGSGAFTGPALWLEIGVRTNGSAGVYTTLAPRRALTPAPYAIFSENIAGNAIGTANLQNSAVTSAKIAVPLSLAGTLAGQAVIAGNNSAAGSGSGLSGTGDTGVSGTGVTTGVSGSSTNGTGVLGVASGGGGSSGVRGNNTSDGYGVLGTAGTNGDGVAGFSSGTGAGVFGSSGSTGYGVEGVASSSGTGVAGFSSTSDGVYGNSGSGDGVHGFSPSASRSGVWGENTGGGYGVSGSSTGSGIGVSGSSSSGLGVSGIGVTGVFGNGGTYGVDGYSASGDGVYGHSGGNGVHGESSSSSQSGVWGDNAGGGPGVSGSSSGGPGVSGSSSNGNGVQGVSSTSSYSAVFGQNTGGGDGVYGSSTSGNAVSGNSTSGIGVHGSTHAASGNIAGVWGENDASNGTALVGKAPGSGGTGLYASGGSGGYAAYLDGNVHVSGTLTAGTKDFKIDHPLDPANKYLLHACVESPDVKNIYDGNITTDAAGDAIVALPDYFEALNRDFRYQLTAIGQFAQAIVSSEIKGNQFSIKTDKPNVKVSWQVTGIRQDAYAKAHPLVVEQDKPASERGTYLHPESFGQPEAKGLSWPRNP